MKATPPLRVARLAQLSAGDLFMMPVQDGGHVGLVVHERADNQTLMLPIGPTLPRSLTYPTLVNPGGATVISFDKDFVVQLPADVSAWQVDEPPPEVTALAVTDAGTFLRCNFSPRERHFQACYVGLADGEICVAGTGPSAAFVPPKGIKAYAVRWSVLTTEDPPRTILAYPFAAPNTAAK